MAAITNGTISSGGDAQDAIAVGHSYKAVILQAITEDMYFNLDANAEDGVGELLAQGSKARINFSSGERLSVWAANTSAGYAIRPTI